MSAARTLAPGEDIVGETIDGTGRREALKGSQLEHNIIARCRLIGGYEDCLDIVRGYKVNIEDCQMIAGDRTRTHITLKGGMHTVTLRRITFFGRTRWPWDVSLGDWTGYDMVKRPPMGNVALDSLRHNDGRPVRVLCRYTEKPQVLGGTVRLIRFPRWFIRAEWRVRQQLLRVPLHADGTPFDLRLNDRERAQLAA